MYFFSVYLLFYLVRIEILGYVVCNMKSSLVFSADYQDYIMWILFAFFQFFNVLKNVDFCMSLPKSKKLVLEKYKIIDVNALINKGGRKMHRNAILYIQEEKWDIKAHWIMPKFKYYKPSKVIRTRIKLLIMAWGWIRRNEKTRIYENNIAHFAKY